MGFSALVVPVPAADWLVAGRAQDEHSAAAGLKVPAHVTLLVPFAPRDDVTTGVLDELDAFFGDVVPFRFSLDEVCRSPDGPVYLAPKPAAPFHHLTAQLSRMFPEYPPYDGRFGEVVPHVTVPLQEGESITDIERLVARHRPLAGHASEAQLVWVADLGLEVLAEFLFGTAAA